MIRDMMEGFWNWLTEPSPIVYEPERRYNAQLLISLLVILLPLGILITLIPPLLDPTETAWQDRDFVVLAGSVIFWVAIWIQTL